MGNFLASRSEGERFIWTVSTLATNPFRAEHHFHKPRGFAASTSLSASPVGSIPHGEELLPGVGLWSSSRKTRRQTSREGCTEPDAFRGRVELRGRRSKISPLPTGVRIDPDRRGTARGRGRARTLSLSARLRPSRMLKSCPTVSGNAQELAHSRCLKGNSLHVVSLQGGKGCKSLSDIWRQHRNRRWVLQLYQTVLFIGLGAIYFVDIKKIHWVPFESRLLGHERC